jgi:hypothetical protein
VQALPGAAIGVMRGRPEETVPQNVPRGTIEPKAEERPVSAPERPVTAQRVLGPEVSEQYPWYRQPPIVARQETSVTTPEILRSAIEQLGPNATPEQLRQFVEQLPPGGLRPIYFQPTQEDVARTAYEIGQERQQSGRNGDALGDYQQAQTELANGQRPAPVTAGESEPWVSAIANRYTAERAARGTLGQVAPGEGVSTEGLLARGLKMGPEQINQHVSDLMSGKGDPVTQAAAVRAQEAQLSQRSNAASRAFEANPSAETRTAMNDAFNDLTDFHNGPVAKIKTIFHGTGMGLQGEVPVDLSTFNGLREAFLRDVGKAPPAEMEPALRKTAKAVSDAKAADQEAMRNLGAAIDGMTVGKKLLSADALRNKIMGTLKDRPCRT